MATAAYPTDVGKWLQELKYERLVYPEEEKQLSVNQEAEMDDNEIESEYEKLGLHNSQYITTVDEMDKDKVISFKDQLVRIAQGCYTPDNRKVCATDDRIIIRNDGENPYQWICRLVIQSGNTQWTGSGFKIKISPDLRRTVIVTAAHVIRAGRNQYVDSVTVHCPQPDNRPPEVNVVRRFSDLDMWMSNEYLQNGNWDYDYGYVSYAGDSDTGFGWQGFMDANIGNLHACGYPSNQNACIRQNQPGLPNPAIFCHQGAILRRTDNRLYADIDIDSGESGGPMFDINNYIVFGIISAFNTCANGREFVRLTAELLYHMFSHLNLQMSYRVRAAPNIYLHMDGTGVDINNPEGGSVYTGARNNRDDTFKIFPVRQNPSSNWFNSQLTAIRSGTQDNIYLQMDGTGVTAEIYGGGGIVQCHLGIDDGQKEVFKKENRSGGQFSFRSETYHRVYLRLSQRLVNGIGDVNCQFGDPDDFEDNFLEPA